MRTKNRDHRSTLGGRAETIVCEYLKGRGFQIVERNARIGPKELDIVARRNNLVVFCEVRSRSSASFVSPLATIGPTKIRNVREAAQEWLRDREVRGVAVRFDAAAVVFDVPEGRLDYIEAAF